MVRGFHGRLGTVSERFGVGVEPVCGEALNVLVGRFGD